MGCRRPRETLEGMDYQVPGIVAGYISPEGHSLYQMEHGNWAVDHRKNAWIKRKVVYFTWDERTNYYGHKPGSVFKW